MFACIYFVEDKSLSVVAKANTDLTLKGEFRAREKVEMFWKDKPTQKTLYHGTIVKVGDEKSLDSFARQAYDGVIKKIKGKPDEAPEDLFKFEVCDAASSGSKRKRTQTERLVASLEQDKELSPKKKKPAECNVENIKKVPKAKNAKKIQTQHSQNAAAIATGKKILEEAQVTATNASTCATGLENQFVTNASPTPGTSEGTPTKETPAASDTVTNASTTLETSEGTPAANDTSMTNTWNMCNSAMESIDLESTLPSRPSGHVYSNIPVPSRDVMYILQGLLRPDVQDYLRFVVDQALQQHNSSKYNFVDENPQELRYGISGYDPLPPSETSYINERMPSAASGSSSLDPFSSPAGSSETQRRSQDNARGQLESYTEMRQDISYGHSEYISWPDTETTYLQDSTFQRPSDGTPGTPVRRLPRTHTETTYLQDSTFQRPSDGTPGTPVRRLPRTHTETTYLQDSTFQRPSDGTPGTPVRRLPRTHTETTYLQDSTFQRPSDGTPGTPVRRLPRTHTVTQMDSCTESSWPVASTTCLTSPVPSYSNTPTSAGPVSNSSQGLSMETPETPLRRSPRKHNVPVQMVKLLETYEIFVAKDGLRKAISAAKKSPKPGYTLTYKLLSEVFSVRELAMSRGQGISTKVKSTDPRSPLDKTKVGAVKDYAVVWRKKNGYTPPTEQIMNDAITERISYARKQLKHKKPV